MSFETRLASTVAEGNGSTFIALNTTVEMGEATTAELPSTGTPKLVTTGLLVPMSKPVIVLRGALPIACNVNAPTALVVALGSPGSRASL